MLMEWVGRLLRDTTKRLIQNESSNVYFLAATKELRCKLFAATFNYQYRTTKAWQDSAVQRPPPAVRK